jgi:hypothetical protein
MKIESLSQSKRSVVAIPAHNEAPYIAECLAALALQRDEGGAPIPRGGLEVLVFANNCSDETAIIARKAALSNPHRVEVVEENMPVGHLNAGWARKRAMDLAAEKLANMAPIHGLILTTDADSRVAPTWFASTLREFEKGADCVAGYIDAIPTEYLALGSEFLAIGGLPPRPVGEDAALTEILDWFGFKVRHSMDVCVSTSCRLDGRATGGAADTMRYRHAIPDAPCDAEIEPALQATRRALCKGLLRYRWMHGPSRRDWPAAVNASREIAGFFDGTRGSPFEEVWALACERSPDLSKGNPLRPSDLPHQIAIAKMITRQLQRPLSQPNSAPGDTLHRAGLSERASMVE